MPPMRVDRLRTRSISASTEKFSRWTRTSMASPGAFVPMAVPPAKGGNSATSSPSLISVSSWAISWFTATNTVFFWISSLICG